MSNNKKTTKHYKIMAHLLFLSTSENELLRLLLLDAMRHYSRDIDADVTFYTSLDDKDDMKEVFACMLDDDRRRLSSVKDLYNKLLSKVVG